MENNITNESYQENKNNQPVFSSGDSAKIDIMTESMRSQGTSMFTMEEKKEASEMWVLYSNNPANSTIPFNRFFEQQTGKNLHPKLQEILNNFLEGKVADQLDLDDDYESENEMERTMDMNNNF